MRRQHEREPTLSEFLTVEEAAARLRVHSQTLLRWIKEGKLPSIKIGRSYRIKPRDLDKLIGEVGEGLRPNEAQVVAVANQKGGVGKTTTTWNTGAAMSERDKRVLLVDMDPQANLTIAMRLQPYALERSIYDGLSAVLSAQSQASFDSQEADFDPHSLIIHTRKMDILPANIELSKSELRFAGGMRREYLLKKLLAPLREEYDVIMIDCPPNLGLLTINALVAADWVVVPVQTEAWAAAAIRPVLDSLATMRSQDLNPNLELAGLLLTMVDTRTGLTHDVIDAIRRAYADRVPLFKTIIKRSVKFGASAMQQDNILSFDPNSPHAAAYRHFAAELMVRIGIENELPPVQVDALEEVDEGLDDKASVGSSSKGGRK